MKRTAFTLALLLSALTASAEKPVRQAQDLPNFIFILSDDIAQGDMGVYGQELIQTPTNLTPSGHSMEPATSRRKPVPSLGPLSASATRKAMCPRARFL